MRTLWRAASQSAHLPVFDTAQDTLRSFTASGRALFYFFTALLIISSVGLLYLLNSALLVAVPAHGGSLAEGIIGAPRFINPVLAISDSDHDLAALVFSGLLKANPDGTYTPDLAQSYTVSPDGTVYTVTLRKNAVFHDGYPVTADDVLFTIAQTQDPQIKSPERANWNGVLVEKVDGHTVRFTLKQAYAPFVENLTLGILPKHLWQDTSPEEFAFSPLNTSPVGSGPFRVSSIARTSAGVPSSYHLAAFDRYALGKPYLNSLVLHFYQNEDEVLQALKAGDIGAASGISPAVLGELPGTALHTPLNRVFGVFFNQNQSEVLRDPAVRQALNDAIDRQDLINQVLDGYGTPLTGPIPPSILPPGAQASTTADGDPALAAQKKLIAAGWQMGPDGILTKGTGAKQQRLAFSLATGNVPELRATAEYLQRAWKRMGADVSVGVYDQGDLAQNVIRPRKYDALLFGEVVGRELDLFAFWDSSQRMDPGLNIAEYANANADKALEALRQTSDPDTRLSLYKQFVAQIQKDNPAVFLYAPDFVYSMQNGIHGVDLGFIETPSDRFLSITQWYRETDHVWPIFARARQ